MYKKEKSKRLSEKNLIAFLILLKTILLLNLPKELAIFYSISTATNSLKYSLVELYYAHLPAYALFHHS